MGVFYQRKQEMQVPEGYRMLQPPMYSLRFWTHNINNFSRKLKFHKCIKIFENCACQYDCR